MSYNPTTKQSEIINEKNKGIIVSASAGSGKTSTMIARIANLIATKKTSIDRLLVLTFTNFSASDMREKLVLKLQDLVAKQNLKLDTLFLVSSSKICTIDSFCQQLVRKYCFEVGVDPNFGVIDDIAKTLLMENAFNSLVLKLWKSQNKVLISLIKTFNENRRLDDLKNIVFNLYHNFCVVEDYNTLLFTTQKSFDVNLKNNIAADYYLQFVLEVVDEILNKINNIQNNVFAIENKDYLNSIKKAVKSLKVDNFENLILNAKAFNLPKKPSFRKDELKQEESDFIKQELKEYLLDLENLLKVLNSSESIEKSILENAFENAQNIFLFTKEFKQEYYNLKKSRYALDFSDIEELAFKILKNKKIRDEVVSAFDYVFVDEYQDVNLMQAKLIDHLANKDMFAVGDAKQSIYGFRLTSPEIFIENFNKALQKNSKIKAKVLTQNFRSTSAILTFVNFVFEKIMTKKTSNMLYDNNAKFDVSDVSSNCAPVEVYVIKKDEPTKQINKTYSISQSNLKCEESNLTQETVIANLINNCLKEGYSEKDIVLLARSKSKKVLNIYKKLVEIGLNISMNFDFDIKETVETSKLNNFLYLINNYKNDVFLFSVLMDFYKVSANDCVVIKSENEACKFFYEAIEEFEKQNINSTNLEKQKIANKLKKFFDDLFKLVTFSENNNVYNLAKKIVEDYNFLTSISLDINGHLENVKKFLNELKKLDVSLAEYANLTLNTSYKVKTDLTKKESITLTTIHASKGLEYKIVFLIDAGKSFNKTDLKKRILIDNNLGITGPAIDLNEELIVDTLPRISAINLKQKNLFNDELRLLYVALTRAEKKLYVVGEQTLNKNVESEYQIKKQNNYLSLILASLNNNQFEKLKNNKSVSVQKNNVEFVKFVYIENQINTTELKPFILPKPNEQIINQYKYLLNENVQSKKPQVLKNTVTRILEKENAKTMFKSCGFLEDEQNESILRGNVYHKFFELFNTLAPDLKQESERVYKILNSSELELINKNYINSFINSEIIDIINSGKILKEQKFVYLERAKNILLEGDDEVLLQGIIDCLIVCEDGIIIIDYKTSHLKEDELVKRYKPQLELYGKAISKIMGKKIKNIYLYSVFSAKIIGVL